jgi:hypothetical protein
MTNKEKKQPNKVFVEAGKTAFRMGILFRNNPYQERPFKTLWEKGYMSEKRKYNQTRRKYVAAA